MYVLAQVTCYVTLTLVCEAKLDWDNCLIELIEYLFWRKKEDLSRVNNINGRSVLCCIIPLYKNQFCLYPANPGKESKIYFCLASVPKLLTGTKSRPFSFIVGLWRTQLVCIVDPGTKIRKQSLEWSIYYIIRQTPFYTA